MEVYLKCNNFFEKISYMTNGLVSNRATIIITYKLYYFYFLSTGNFYYSSNNISLLPLQKNTLSHPRLADLLSLNESRTRKEARTGFIVGFRESSFGVGVGVGVGVGGSDRESHNSVL